MFPLSVLSILRKIGYVLMVFPSAPFIKSYYKIDITSCKQYKACQLESMVSTNCQLREIRCAPWSFDVNISSIIVRMVLQVSSKEMSFAYSYSRLYFSHSLRSVSLSCRFVLDKCFQLHRIFCYHSKTSMYLITLGFTRSWSAYCISL